MKGRVRVVLLLPLLVVLLLLLLGLSDCIDDDDDDDDDDDGPSPCPGSFVSKYKRADKCMRVMCVNAAESSQTSWS